MVNIPTVIDFAGKMSKATSKSVKLKECMVEALACLIEHVGLIKFWAVNSKNDGSNHTVVECGSFKSFMRFNDKVSAAEDYVHIFNHPVHMMQELKYRNVKK